ncbi:MAG: type II secretion system protein [Armatimonadota bacterium]
MKRLRCRRAGFTLVELLVVIAIITVLIAIALPVFKGARESARQRACMANLHQLAMAIRMYRMDMGFYPGPYDPATGEGGLNALYPAYVGSRKVFVCPDDLTDSGDKYVAQKVRIYDTATTYREVPYTDLLAAASRLYSDIDPEYFLLLWKGDDPNTEAHEQDPTFFVDHYSSYNAMYNWSGYVGFAGQGENRQYGRRYQLLDRAEQYLNTGDNLAFWYAWYRWDPEDVLGVWGSADVYDRVTSQLQYHFGQQTYWNDYDPADLQQQRFRLQDSLRRPLWDPGNPDPNSYEYMPYGMPSPVFPGMINRNAPDSAIITRCIHHRQYTVERIRTPVGPPSGGGGRGGRGGGSNVETTITVSESPKDIVLRLDGSAALVVGLNYDWAVQPEVIR